MQYLYTLFIVYSMSFPEDVYLTLQKFFEQEVKVTSPERREEHVRSGSVHQLASLDLEEEAKHFEAVGPKEAVDLDLLPLCLYMYI